MRSIFEAGAGVADVVAAGERLELDLPAVPTRPLDALPARGARMTAPKTPTLAPDLVAGLKRLKLATVRAMAPEILQTAKTQRWAPEEVLRSLVEAEIATREQSNMRARLRTAGFPVTKTLEEFDVGLSSVPAATYDYLASLEWIAARENLCLVGPAGTGMSHMLIALGHH